MMTDDDNDGQMIFGDLGGLKLPDIGLTGEEKPWKNFIQETCRTDQGSKPGPLHDRHPLMQIYVVFVLSIFSLIKAHVGGLLYFPIDGDSGQDWNLGNMKIGDH